MRHNKFTLVELLVVICIASLLMGVVLPAFNRMVTGSAVDRLASNLKLRLERAQSQAASSRRHVALILPHGTDWKESAEKAARLGGSRMCYVEPVTKEDNGKEEYDAVFQRWVPEEEWSEAERGAQLVLVTRSVKNLPEEGTALSNRASKTTSSLLLSAETDAGSKGLKTLHCKEGKTKLDMSETETPGSCAVVFRPKGGLNSKSDVYFVVAEAMKNGDDLIYPNGGYNYRILRVDRLTGKVEYYR